MGVYTDLNLCKEGGMHDKECGSGAGKVAQQPPQHWYSPTTHRSHLLYRTHGGVCVTLTQRLVPRFPYHVLGVRFFAECNRNIIKDPSTWNGAKQSTLLSWYMHGAYEYDRPPGSPYPAEALPFPSEVLPLPLNTPAKDNADNEEYFAPWMNTVNTYTTLVP